MSGVVWKLLGSFLLFFAGGYLSVSVTGYERRRLTVLDGYLSLLYHIKGQIDCYAMPVREIMIGLDPTLAASCLGVDDPAEARAYLADLLASPEPPLPALVRESHAYLEAESERLLTAFAHELGGTHRADQVSRCDHYIFLLTEERRRLLDTIPTRMRVGATLCLCAAAGVAVILW